MKYLFLTNLYPPCSQGGYEAWCQEVAEGLRLREHEVIVLTSRHGRAGSSGSDPDWVQRDLFLEMSFASFRNSIDFFTKRKKQEMANLATLRQVVETFAPDCILVWGMWNFTRALPALAEDLMPAKVAYYIGDYWLTLPSQFVNYWNVPARTWKTAIIKSLLKPIALAMLSRETTSNLQLEHLIFPTAFMSNRLQEYGVPFKKTAVIYGAVNLNAYQFSKRQMGLNYNPDRPIHLLYVGRLSHDKGVHTAIEALALLQQQSQITCKLTIVGTGTDPLYEARLYQQITEHKLTSAVQFLGACPKAAMPGLYAQADVCLFTSIWQEPFGRVIIEAMASGAVVVGTATGGAAEIMIDKQNALLFEPDNAADLADRISTLAQNPNLYHQLAQAGCQTAHTKFGIEQMIAGLEDYLAKMAED